MSAVRGVPSAGDEIRPVSFVTLRVIPDVAVGQRDLPRAPGHWGPSSADDEPRLARARSGALAGQEDVCHASTGRLPCAVGRGPWHRLHRRHPNWQV